MKDAAYPRHEEHLAFQQVLRRLAQVLARFRGVETRLACYLFEPVDPERKKWEISWWQAPDFHPRYFVLHMDAGEAAFLERLMEAEEVSWVHVARLPFLQNLVHLERYRSFYWVPVRIADRLLAVLLFVHPGRRYFDAGRRALVETVGDVYALLHQNRMCREALLKTRKRIYQLEDEVRRRLARDLHDGPAQTLSALVMEAQYLHRVVEEQDPQVLREALKELENRAYKAMNEIRQVLYILRPLALEQGSLEEALEQLVTRMRQIFPGELEVDVAPDVLQRLNLEQKRHLFYLVAEALNNAIKHANAQTIRVRLHSEGDMAVLEVEDDGLGFDPNTLKELRLTGHYGILNMSERAELLGGHLDLESQPGQGTRIRVRFPLHQVDASLLSPSEEESC